MKIAAFNIQKFGRSKVSDPEVLKILIKVTRTSVKTESLQTELKGNKCVPSSHQIVSRYDIILILEVVDISGDSVETFLDALNT